MDAKEYARKGIKNTQEKDRTQESTNQNSQSQNHRGHSRSRTTSSASTTIMLPIKATSDDDDVAMSTSTEKSQSSKSSARPKTTNTPSHHLLSSYVHVQDPNNITPKELDSLLQTCSREPIHIPAMIQSHGMLFAISEKAPHHIIVVSQNFSKHLDKMTDKDKPKHIVDTPFQDLLIPKSTTLLLKTLKTLKPAENGCILVI